MSRPLMSAAAAALLRALLRKAGANQSRILLTDWTTTDWQSLTFAGERHVAGFAIAGKDALAIAREWTSGLDEADLPIGSSCFVGDIAVTCGPELREDGKVFVGLEALTLAS